MSRGPSRTLLTPAPGPGVVPLDRRPCDHEDSGRDCRRNDTDRAANVDGRVVRSRARSHLRFRDHGVKVGTQGAAFGVQKVDWDIRMVDGLQNQKVGNMLSVLYATERFWYGDHFYVQFTL